MTVRRIRMKTSSQDLRGFDKDMREWNAYVGLESTVKNMMTRCKNYVVHRLAKNYEGDKSILI